MDNSIADTSSFRVILGFALVVAAVEACAQSSLKLSLINNNKKTLCLGLFLYIGVGYVLHAAYNEARLSQMNLVWSCISIVTSVTIGYMLYDEPVSHYTVLAVMSALLATYFAYLSNC